MYWAPSNFYDCTSTYKHGKQVQNCPTNTPTIFICHNTKRVEVSWSLQAEGVPPTRERGFCLLVNTGTGPLPSCCNTVLNKSSWVGHGIRYSTTTRSYTNTKPQASHYWPVIHNTLNIPHQWSGVLFCDESRFCLLRSDGHSYVRRSAGEKFPKKSVLDANRSCEKQCTLPGMAFHMIKSREHVKVVVDSMPRKCEAVIRAMGGATRY